MENQTRIPPKPPGRPPIPNAQPQNNQVIKPAEGALGEINIRSAAQNAVVEPHDTPLVKSPEVATKPSMTEEKKQAEKKVKKEKTPKVKVVKPKKEKIKKPMTLNRGLFWTLIALAGVFSVLVIVLICILNAPIEGLS